MDLPKGIPQPDSTISSPCFGPTGCLLIEIHIWIILEKYHITELMWSEVVIYTSWPIIYWFQLLSEGEWNWIYWLTHSWAPTWWSPSWKYRVSIVHPNKWLIGWSPMCIGILDLIMNPVNLYGCRVRKEIIGERRVWTSWRSLEIRVEIILELKVS